MSRRATLGGPLSGSSAHNSSSGSGMDASSRKSMGGKFAPIAKGPRHSMAPGAGGGSGASSSRMSMAPQSSNGGASSRQSMGGAGVGAMDRRTSLSGARNAAVDRKSGGGRRSSVGARSGGAGAGGGVRSDPRPISDKGFVKENIRKIIVYLTSHHYTHQIAPKQLSSPSTKDFKNIILFLFQQLDRNFEFQTTNIAFEDAVKMYMKRFGYPFNISKNALQAAGSPHTWPSLLAMLVWFVEFLQYHENVHGAPAPLDGSGALSTAAPAATESEARLFFEYASGAYLAFLQGEDNFTSFDEALARKFEHKNVVVSDEIRRLQVRNEEADALVSTYNAALSALADLTAFRNACVQDVPVLEDNIRNNQAYLDSVKSKRAARQAELEVRTGVLASCEAEKAQLVLLLSKQVFTPLQVQEMMHQKSTLESTLDAQTKQQEAVQNEIWNREMDTVKKMTDIEKATNEFNEVSLALASATSKSSMPFLHTELRFHSGADSAASMLSLDLKAHKDMVQSAKDALLAAKKEVGAELKRQAPLLASLQELESERMASVDNLSKRSSKISDLYTEERAKMNRQVEASCIAVEDVELDIVKLRNELSGMALEGVAAQQAASLDDQIARMEAAHMAEEAALKADICHMMQELTEHKVAITERLEQMIAHADAIKNNIKQMDLAQHMPPQ